MSANDIIAAKYKKSDQARRKSDVLVDWVNHSAPEPFLTLFFMLTCLSNIYFMLYGCENDNIQMF